MTLHRSGERATAGALYRRILELDRGNFDALHLLGVVAAQEGDPGAALALMDRATQIKPKNAAVHCNRGVALRALRQLDAALTALDTALALQPDYVEAQLHRGVVLCELRRPQAALESFQRALALRPDCAEAHLRCGNVLRDMMQLDAALASYNAALEIKADYAEACLNRGTVLRELMQLEAALESYDRAIALRADYAEAYANRATLRLLLGDFANGWRDYEWRWRIPAGSNMRQRSNWPQPPWRGDESLAAKTILLSCEQGLGDTLQFCRFARVLTELGARVVLEVQPPLATLLATMDTVAQVFAYGSEPPATFDLHCPLLSLPLALGTRVDTIPAAPGYLHADPHKVALWRSKLGAHERPRIGLSWSGNPLHSHDRYRSIPLRVMLDGLPAHFRYVSLQRDVGEEDARTLQARPQLLDVRSELRDFSDTAALCACLDLVISVDSAVAHLNGALGRPTWLLLPFHPDWRWLTARNDSPWYDSVRLFRQPRMGAWPDVLARVSDELVGSAGVETL